MVMRVFTDIETLPPAEDMRQQLSAAKIRKLLRKGVKDEQGEVTCTEEEFRCLALHAEYGRVLTIGLVVEVDDQVIHRGVLGRERQTMTFHLNEARTLRGFWKLLKDFRPSRDLIIGHNVFWDLKFLKKRSVINRVQPSIDLPFAKFRSQPIFDTMQEWCNWDFGTSISLVHLAEVLQLGMSKTEGMDGSRVYDQFCAGCHETIAEYCLQDVELVRAVYYRMQYPERTGPHRQADQVSAETVPSRE
jgi:3'-5' exonuclease